MTDRNETWSRIARMLTALPAGGTLYLSRPRQKVRAGHTWPWPDISGDRTEELEQLGNLLLQLRGAWVLSFVKDGDKMDSATRWPWPAEEGLFTAQQRAEDAATAASNPVSYTTEIDPFATDANDDEVGPTVPPVAPALPVPAAVLPVPALPAPQAEPAAEVMATEPDIDEEPVSMFECHWPGVGSFTFNRAQRAVFDVLASAYLNTDTPEMEEAELLRRAGVEGESLDVLFANIRSWRAMILRNTFKGTVRMRPIPMGEFPGEME